MKTTEIQIPRAPLGEDPHGDFEWWKGSFYHRGLLPHKLTAVLPQSACSVPVFQSLPSMLLLTVIPACGWEAAARPSTRSPRSLQGGILPF